MPLKNGEVSEISTEMHWKNVAARMSGDLKINLYQISVEPTYTVV